MNVMARIFSIALLSGYASFTLAGEPQQARITLSQAYARSTVPGQEVGAGYLTIENQGSLADRLLSVTSNASQSVELHGTTTEQGITRMRRENSLEIPARGKLEFKPGGLHLMLVGLKSPLHSGDTVSLRLKFEKSGELELKMPVKGMEPGDHSSMEPMDHSRMP